MREKFRKESLIKKEITRDSKNIIVGIYNPAKNGDFGFVDIEGEDKGYFVFAFNKKDALPGDKVEAIVKEFKGKKEAVVLRVLERSNNIFVGEFQPVIKNNKKVQGHFDRDYTFGFVVIKDDNFKKDIFVSGKNLKNAKPGDIVGVRVIKFDSKSPEGEIVEIIGKKGDIGIDINSYIISAGFKQRFPIKIDYELKHFIGDITKEQFKYRKDLRNLFTFTIDSEDAKDLDDAISIKIRKNGNYELYVHIADVSHYIREGSSLDKEARKRGTSVYLADRVIPMLPEKLSNELCSLNPDNDKLTITCEMLIGIDGQIKKSKVYESIINSDYRLTYKEVDDIVDSKKIEKLFCNKNISNELIQTIKSAENLRSYIEKNKEITGVLNFDFPETKIVVDDNKNVVEIKQYPRYKSNKMIEEFMVSANHSVSKLFSNFPFLHRIHPKPGAEDLSKLQNILNLFGVNFNFKDFSTKEFSELLELISKNTNKQVLEKTVLRSLSKAIYSDENEGHFGLGLNFYSHFTSPIRRYPDLQIHRIIKEKISNRLDYKRIKHYESILKGVADNSSTQERKAEKLEYKIRDYFIVKHYSGKIGEVFEGTINGVIEKGIFVQLQDTAEGFVELKDLIGFIYREELMDFIDSGSKKQYKLGDKISVKLIEADLNNLRLNFELV